MCRLIGIGIGIGKNRHFLQESASASAHSENCRFRADSYVLEMYIIKKKNDANVYKFQSEIVQFQILAFETK
jgi:hypothetical protein